MNNKKNPLILINLILNDFILKDELKSILNISESSFNKYIGLFKKADFKILRKKSFYKLSFFNNTFMMTESETSVLAYLLALSFVSFSNKKYEEIKNTVLKILYLSNKDTYNKTMKKFEFLVNNLTDSLYSDKLKLLEKYIEQKEILRIILTNNKELILKPVGFEYGIEKIYVNFSDIKRNETKRLSAAQIKKMIPYKLQSHSLEKEKPETVFELYGRLAKTYLLKEDEKIIKKDKNKIVIANSSSDKNILFQRLLRYDILCKVVYPESDIVKFQELVDKSIQNLMEAEK